MEEVRKVLMSNDNVSDIHHFHIWSLDGEHSVMTAHVELRQDISISQLRTLKDELRHDLDEFDFVHTTIEIEFANEDCRDE
jgi:cobalt-zinc-cadmium efflux system protein